MSHHALSPEQFHEQYGKHGIEPAEKHGFTPVPEAEWRDVQHQGMQQMFRINKTFDPATPVRTGQPGVYADTVRDYSENIKSVLKQGAGDPIEVIHHEGAVYMGQGHHRLAAARAAGLKKITVHEYGRP